MYNTDIFQMNILRVQIRLSSSNVIGTQEDNRRVKEDKYKKRLLLRCIRHFKSDLINNMDHTRISGTEPSSVILSQTN